MIAMCRSFKRDMEEIEESAAARTRVRRRELELASTDEERAETVERFRREDQAQRNAAMVTASQLTAMNTITRNICYPKF
jgi:hypothetical protein